MKKLLFITTRLFWPTDSGRKLSLYHCCKALHDELGYEVYLYSFLEDGQTPELLDSKPDCVTGVRIAKKIGKLSKIGNLLFSSVLGGKSFQNALFYSRANLKAIRAYFDEVQPDVVMFDMLRTAKYLKAFKKFNGKKIICLDDLLSKRYARQAETNNSKGNVGGKFAGELPGVVSKLIKNPKTLRKVLLSESKRIAKEEIYYTKKFDYAVLCSEKEAAEFGSLNGFDNVVAIRHCVDFDYLSQKISECTDRRLIGFVGNFNYAPNVDSLDIIVKEIVPKLKNSCKLIIAGAVPEEIKEKYSADGSVEFLGMVDDLRSVIQKCGVFLSPIAYGSGVKTKILEAMAMGIPVVTNALGIEGIDGENGVHFLVAEDYEEIAANVDALVEDKARALSIADAAQKLIYEKYRWEITLESYRKIGL